MPFSAAKINYINNCPKSLLLDKTNNFILHVWTNGLDSDKSTECIAETIVKQTILLKNDGPDVTISKFIKQKDKLNVKCWR